MWLSINYILIRYFYVAAVSYPVGTSDSDSEFSDSAIRVTNAPRKVHPKADIIKIFSTYEGAMITDISRLMYLSTLLDKIDSEL